MIKLPTLLKQIKPDLVGLLRFTYKLGANLDLLKDHVKTQNERVEIYRKQLINNITSTGRSQADITEEQQKLLLQLEKQQLLISIKSTSTSTRINITSEENQEVNQFIGDQSRISEPNIYSTTQSIPTANIEKDISNKFTFEEEKLQDNNEEQLKFTKVISYRYAKQEVEEIDESRVQSNLVVQENKLFEKSSQEITLNLSKFNP